MRIQTYPLLLLVMAAAVGCEIPETTRNLFFPPDDLYKPLATAPIDFATEGAVYRLTATHKYPGWHSIAISVPNPPPVAQPFPKDFTLTISVSSASEELLPEQVANTYSSFWAGDRGGLHVLRYKVPEDLPRDIPLVFQVTVRTPDPGFAARYGAATLSIEKGSDE